MITPREWPRDALAEAGVLGSVLRDPTRLDDVALIVRPDDFFSALHARIFGAILERHRTGQAVDYLLISGELEDDPSAKPEGFGIDDLRALMDEGVVPENAPHYAARVAETAKHRRLIQAATGFVDRLWRSDADEADEAAAEMEAAIGNIRSEGVALRAQPIGKVAADALAAMHRAADGEFTGLPTAWPEVDRLIGGLEPGRLIVVAGRPGSGKSSFALNLARHVAAETQMGAYFVSLEMSDKELGVRQLSADTGLPGSQLASRPDSLLGRHWHELARAVKNLDGLPVWIDHTGSKTIDQICDETRVYVRKHGVGLLVIDHVGLVSLTKAQRQLTRQQQVGTFTRALKLLAKDLRIPVVALSQLNRESEAQNRRPHLSNLRESGDVEQDADIVLMIHREDLESSIEAEILVRKNRSGPCGTVILTFDRATTTFRSRVTPEAAR